MADVIWTNSNVDWAEEEDTGNGTLKVTTLHWRANLTEGEFSAGSYGTTPDDQNRVFTEAALNAVPESVRLGWVAQALGEETVTNIEEQLATQIVEQQNPTRGTINY